MEELLNLVVSISKRSFAACSNSLTDGAVMAAGVAVIIAVSEPHHSRIEDETDRQGQIMTKIHVFSKILEISCPWD